MKDKKLLHVLLPAVVIIWILIGYRLYNAVKGDDHPLPSARPVTIAEATEDIEPYQLQLNYADPFLKHRMRQHTVHTPLTYSRPITPKNLPEVINASPTVDWSIIAYAGMISNNQTDYRVGIITINGTRKLVHENDKVPPFVIEEITKDSVRISTQEEVRYVVRQGRIKCLSQKP